MIGVVICTHHRLATALVETAEMIVGHFPLVEVVPVLPGDGMDDVHGALKKAISSVDEGAGVLLLCDMFGGTPSNLSLSFLGETVEVLTGVNLPMLLKLYTSREGPLSEVAATVRDHARENILVAGEVLHGGGSGT